MSMCTAACQTQCRVCTRPMPGDITVAFTRLGIPASLLLVVKSLVVNSENQLVKFPILPVSSHPAIQHVILGVNLHVLFFATTFQESAEHQHNDTMTNDQNTFLSIVAGQRT